MHQHLLHIRNLQIKIWVTSKYTANARSYSESWISHMAARDSSQYDANSVAVEKCNLRATNNDCYVRKEGLVDVWEKNVAHLIAKDEEEKKKKELAEQRKKEEATLTSLNLKKGTCTKMGFESETEGMANCVLQLTLQENQSNTIVTNSSSDSGMVDAMNDQTRIMERQLRIQRQQNIREATKAFQKAIGYDSFGNRIK